VSRRANAIHPGILIGFVVLALVTATAVFIAHDASKNLETALSEKEKLQKDLDRTLLDFQSEKKVRVEQGRYIFGWDSNGDNPRINMETLENKILEMFAHEIDPNLKTVEEKLKYVRNKRLILTDYDVPAKQYEAKVAGIAEEYAGNVASLKSEIDALNKQIETLNAEHERELEDRQETVDELNQKNGELLQSKEEMVSAHQDAIENYEGRIDELTLSFGDLKRRKQMKIDHLMVENAALREREREASLKEKAQLRPDGKIINVDSSEVNQTVYINLGSEDRVAPGMRFHVFQWGPGGVQIAKAEIVLRQVNPYTSKAGIISVVDEMNPLIEGDLIANLAYDPDSARTFALIGTFKNFTKEELKRQIEMEGGKVFDEVNASLDFVVLGKFSELENDMENQRYKRAKSFQLQMINENDIRTYLRDYSDLSRE
jgi:hypothetical protein